MNDPCIYIGLSGWSYREWKNIFYPPALKPVDYLAFYAQFFRAAEINTSFYHIPKKETVTGWKNKVNPGFHFCPKLNKRLTHIKRLHEPEESLEKFFDSFTPLKDLLGPVLMQLPPSLKFDAIRVKHLFEVLSKDYKDYDFALEVRHETWLCDESIELLKEYNIALVTSQSGVNFPYTEVLTSKHAYIRFHGPKELYASAYTNKMLKDFAKKFIKWRNEGHTVWVFFNNTMLGDALENAKQLHAYITEKDNKIIKVAS